VALQKHHFGVLVAGEADERARRAQRLGVIEATFDPLPIDAAVAREWGRLAAAVFARGGQPRRRAVDLAIAATANVAAVPLLTHLVDGNRRLAWLATYVFLAKNDIELDPQDDAAYDLVIAVAAGTIDEVEEIAAGLASFAGQSRG
jgi:hypothetical protein